VQCFTGINTVIFYSTTIFGFAGINDSLLATLCVNGVNLLATGISSILVDRVGRKSLVEYGLVLMIVALTGLSSVLYAGDTLGKSNQGAVAIICVMLYMFGFAAGMGSAVWVIMAEFTPNDLRSTLMSLFLNVNWACNILLGLTTLEAIRSLGKVPKAVDDDTYNNADAISEHQKNGVAMMYFLFLGLTVACMLFVRLLVPETGNRLLRQNSSSDLLKSMITPVVNEE
jgi:hypothetical protein